MAGKQAKILSDAQISNLLFFADTTRYPLRNRVIVLLSTKAGLRAGEIAKLTWDMVLDANGDVGTSLELLNKAAKKGSGRRIPLHPQLRQLLAEWRTASAGEGPVVRSERGGPMLPISIVIWFADAYRAMGLDGCSSHSGRRTFITRAARLVHKAGGSLRDVQLLAGHRFSNSLRCRPGLTQSLRLPSLQQPDRAALKPTRRPFGLLFDSGDSS